MKSVVGTLMIVGLALLAPLSARANDPSASIPTPADARPVPRHWQGTATEVPGIYSGPAVAKVSLELNPDGTFTQTWTQGSQELKTSGTWREEGDRVILASSDPMRPRMTLRHRGNALYAMAMEELPTGRATTTAIELHPAAN